ncbi:putative Ubiquitin-like domain-containing protein [Helianthus annuus]|nr:putative Ubiquitin-like domain-containing protein [Helianthus annuus]
MASIKGGGDNVSVKSVESESAGVANQHSDAANKHSDKGDIIAEVALESLKPKGGVEKQPDKDETIAAVARVADEHSDKGDRIAEVAIESLKSEGVADKRPDEGESIAEVALDALKSKGVADKHSDEAASGSTVEMLVSTFKETIASEVGLPVDQQRLIFRGKVFKDEDRLSEYQPSDQGHNHAWIS